MSGPGSGGNVIAALCSFFFPGLGQLLQGRLITAAIHFVLVTILWLFLARLDHAHLVMLRRRPVPSADAPATLKPFTLILSHRGHRVHSELYIDPHSSNDSLWSLCSLWLDGLESYARVAQCRCVLHR